MRLTRNRMYGLTAIAAALWVFLLVVFSDGMFSLSHLWYQADPKDHVKVFADGTIWTYVLLALIIAAGIYQARRLPDEGIEIAVADRDSGVDGQVDDPKGWRWLMGNTWAAVLWMPIRFYIGMAFLAAGEHKIAGNTWSTGAGLKGYWTAAIGTADKPGTAYYAWYRDFLQYMLNHEWYTWFAKLIMWGEVLVGVGLIVGALVGIAAFFGTFLNMNFLMAGTVSTNPVMFGLGVFLVLGWKVAGYVGIDRYLLPALGAPWAPGRLLGGTGTPKSGSRPTVQRGHAD